MRHLLSIADLDRDEIVRLLARAEKLEQGAEPRQARAGAIAVLAFFQPSTRSRLGFFAATTRLGLAAVDFAQVRRGPEMSTAESLEDTVTVASAYADLLVMRHPENGALTRAAASASCSVVNAGEGTLEHPTQALVDLLAIRGRMGRLDGLRIGIVGDLAGSRAAHSLLRALTLFAPAEVRLMAPAGREAGARWLDGLPTATVTVETRLVAEGLDVLYMAGLPAGTGEGALGPEERGRFRLTSEGVCALPATAAVLCPLPRIDEIDTKVDSDPRAAWFEQSRRGLYVRMACCEAALFEKGASR